MSSLPENTVLTSRREYEAALTAVLAHAQHKLFIFDPDLTFGGFEAAENVARLRDLLVRQPAAKVTLVLQDTRYLLDRCPRLLGLMRQYQHAMTVYETNDEGKRVSDSFVLADDHAYLRRFHVDQVRFKFSLNDTATARLLGLRFEELLQLTHHQISTTPLGL
ncbi:hypothetical protein [Methylovorus sp. MP688]|jgi:hypothetical protein|uniref:DUF7931 domain-containing protein n=1 Tax=Methylovorus sp. (strain MP688) TaxID=887061 RepID=UPI0001EC4879|nr:hypothetical protein [Methylovorus sp. MP688]ADQ84960.1 conserved hypothetical protein [Methylovorus sp. MP688]